MFTGIVEETGVIKNITPAADAMIFTISCRLVLEDAHQGDSVCISGVCLTITGIQTGEFECLAGAETLRKSNLGNLKTASRVNLERSITLGTRLGGHLVQGHVESTGVIASIIPEGETQLWQFSVPKSIAGQLVEKGSIAVNGVSLTVINAGEDSFQVSLIPATLIKTTFSDLKPGDTVNIETDIIGRYVQHFTRPYQTSPIAASRE
jgi:riboflavin synthase